MRLYPSNAVYIACCLLFFCCLPMSGHAQTDFTVYSDTVSTLQDTAQDSLWNQMNHAYGSGFTPMNDMKMDNIFDFMSQMLGLTGFLFIVVMLLIFGFPLIAIGLIIYLVYRLNREKNRHREQMQGTGAVMMDEATTDALNKQKAIRRACWGIGLIAVEWIAGITILLYISGVILLCAGAANWLTTLIHKK